MSRPATIAIAGCGAVTERYYAPALAMRADGARLIGFYDSDTSRMAAIAHHFPDARGVTSFGTLLDLRADMVILASPPAAHAEQAIAALCAGSHVLCEKPMALSGKEAEAMATAAKEHDRLLAVNMVRRHFPASRIVETFVRNQSLGALCSVSAFEGGPFRWPIRNQSYFSRAVSGGGVLADVGTHVIDLLASWLGEAEFMRYEDDAMGGVETNALIELQWGNALASVRLSRDWGRPNLIELVFEKASLRWRAERLDSVELQYEGEPPLVIADEAARDFGFVDCFGAQIDAMLDHLAGKTARLVIAEQTLPTVALIERAYGDRTPMPMPWLEPYGASAHG